MDWNLTKGDTMKIAIIGGCGGVGAALEPMLAGDKHTLRILDMNLDRVHQMESLKPEWAEGTLTEDAAGKVSIGTLCKDGAEVIIDLTALNKVEVIKEADDKKVSVINSTMLGAEQYTGDYLYYLAGCWSIPSKLKTRHIVSCGMNPGNINVFARILVDRHGKDAPEKIWYWEYESAARTKGNGAFITWSPHEFHSEVCEDCGWMAEGQSINLQNDRPYRHPYKLAGVMGAAALEASGTPAAAKGWLVPHEEVLSTAWDYDTQCGYIYGLADENRKALEALLEQDGPLPEYLASSDGLTGLDRVGVTVYWGDESKSMWAEMPHDSEVIPPGSNATDWMVAIAIQQAVRDLARNRTPGLMRPDELDCEEWLAGLKRGEGKSKFSIEEV